MIIQPTNEQTRRVNRSRAYSGPGFGRESFACIGIGLSLGIANTASRGPAGPVSLLGSSLLAYAHFGYGVTLDTTTTTTVSAVADRAPTANNFSNGAKSIQPLFTAADATLNNAPTALFDGVDDRLFSSLALPAPGTTPFSFFGVIKVVAATSFGAWMADNSNTGAPGLLELSSTTVRAQSGGAGAVGAYAVGTWYRFRADFSNSATDIFKIGSAANVTGQAGNGNAAGLAIGSAGAQNYANIAVAEIGVAQRTPAQMTTFLASYDTYVAATYPACQI